MPQAKVLGTASSSGSSGMGGGVAGSSAEAIGLRVESSGADASADVVLVVEGLGDGEFLVGIEEMPEVVEVFVVDVGDERVHGEQHVAHSRLLSHSESFTDCG
jgi:hypothetical protein